MKLYILQVGDSKVRGADGAKDRLGVPVLLGPGNYGAGYNSVPTVGLSGTTDGAGGVLTAALFDPAAYPANSKAISVFPSVPGAGYIDETKKPIITVSGGTPTTVATFNTSYVGGTAPGLESGLRAAAYDVQVINLGYDGTGISNFDPPGSYNAQSLIAAINFFGAANCLLSISTGINDAINAQTAASWQTNFSDLVTFAKGLGVKVVANKTCWLEQATAGYTDAQITAANNFLAQYATAIDTVVSANSTAVSFITDEHAILSTAPTTYFNGAQGIHQNTAAYNALVADMLPKYKTYIDANFPTVKAAPATDPYRSDNATPVTILADYKPGAPNPFAGTGLGTFLLPTVVLTWINPANLLGGTIHIMRMNAGTSDPFVVVGTVAGPDANTAPAQTYTDTTVLNGHRYTYTAFATPYGDTTTP